MKNKIVFSVFITIFSLYFTGCAKDGDMGPAGQDGKDGNANVTNISSPITWTNINATSYSVTFNTALITQDIINKGTIIVSVSNDNSTWMQLPFNTGAYSLFYWYQPGSIYLRVVQITSGSFEPTVLYKYIKIAVIAGN